MSGSRVPEESRITPTGSDLAATLARIDARLDRLERTLAPFAELGRTAPDLAATVGDILDEQAAKLGDVEYRVQALGDVLERLSRPDTLASLRKVVDLAESAPDLLATMTDVFDETMAEAEAEGLDLTHVIGDAKHLAMGLLRLTTSRELKALLSSGMLDPKALGILGMVAKSTADAQETEPPRVGLVGVMRALGDADVQRATGFVLRIATSFGRALARTDKRLTAGSTASAPKRKTT